MLTINEGQCGMCKHFGEHDSDAGPTLVQIRTTKSAPEDFTESCGHPQLEPIQLTVTPVSSCAGYEPAAA
ncbi:MAG: hypothetical protein AAF750_11380 [Planctomycetota bacterium]